MRLAMPVSVPWLSLIDIDGQVISTSHPGRKVLLSFLREANCPFCSARLAELLQHHSAWREAGLIVIVVLASDVGTIRRYILTRDPPFHLVCDPDTAIHRRYGIQCSLFGKLLAYAGRFPTFVRGLRDVGWAGLRAGNLLPADFLIDGFGRVVETHYGEDAGDHLPIERIHRFLFRPSAAPGASRASVDTVMEERSQG